MTEDRRPVIAAYDGSPASDGALRAAATLFAGRTIVVVSVWEPGLAMVVLGDPDPSGFVSIPPSREQIATVDQAQHDRAAALAETGATIVRGLGATAEALPVADNVEPGEAVAAIAEQRDSAAIVVGSRGLGRMRSAVVGSTSRHLLQHTRRPVLVVRDGR